VKKGDIDKEILRLGIAPNLTRSSLYEQMAAATENENIRIMIRDIAREEKNARWRISGAASEIDEEQVRELMPAAKRSKKKQNRGEIFYLQKRPHKGPFLHNAGYIWRFFAARSKIVSHQYRLFHRMI